MRRRISLVRIGRGRVWVISFSFEISVLSRFFLRRLHMIVDHLAQLRQADQPRSPVYQRSALEQQQCRQSADVKLGYKIDVRHCVQLPDLSSSGVLAGDYVDEPSQSSASTATLSPYV